MGCHGCIFIQISKIWEIQDAILEPGTAVFHHPKDLVIFPQRSLFLGIFFGCLGVHASRCPVHSDGGGGGVKREGDGDDRGGMVVTIMAVRDG